MPYDAALDGQTIAQMRAEMLRRFDDGASLLGQNPDMLQVGLFGRAPKKAPAAPVNMSRRSAIGLPEIPIPMTGESAGQLVPKPTDVPQPSTLQPPIAATQQQVTPQQSANPLGQLANKALNAPMSRREVLQRAGQAALQQALPTPKIANAAQPIISQVATPLAESTSLFPLATANILREVLNETSQVQGDPISDVEHYLQYVDPSKIEPSRLELIKKDLAEYDADATDESEHFDRLRAYPEELINALDDKALLNELLNMHDESITDMAESLHTQGMTKDAILDFFKQHYKKRYSKKALEQHLSDLED